MPEAPEAEMSGQIVGNEHRYRLRIYYEDTDAGGIVYHADYLKFAERARTEMLRVMGQSHSDIIARDGVMFIVRKADVDFRSPARLDDILEVRTVMHEVRGATIKATQSLYKLDGDTIEAPWLVNIDLLLACIGQDSGRPARVPASLVGAIRELADSRDNKGQDDRR